MEQGKANVVISKVKYANLMEALNIKFGPQLKLDIEQVFCEVLNYNPNASSYNESQARAVRNYRAKQKESKVKSSSTTRYQ